jgi:hypothetical protein
MRYVTLVDNLMNVQLSAPRRFPAAWSSSAKDFTARDWRGAVAHALGVDRATPWRWLAGKRTSRDIDTALVDAERDIAAARSVEIGQLQRTLLAFVNRGLA